MHRGHRAPGQRKAHRSAAAEAQGRVSVPAVYALFQYDGRAEHPLRPSLLAPPDAPDGCELLHIELPLDRAPQAGGLLPFSIREEALLLY